MSKKKKVCTTLNYIELLRILDFSVTGNICTSASGYLLDIPVGIITSAIKLKICAIIPGIKKSIIKKKRSMIK